ncbi:MAG: DUF5329 family protein [Planctomycetes bacterium]|nr:DUF5329 family protein [Planctomycetota bacterium]
MTRIIETADENAHERSAGGRRKPVILGMVAMLLLIGAAAGCTPSTLQTKRTAITSEPKTPRSDSIAIRLSNVPQPLSLPGRKGENRILTATVQGGPMASVWLAPVATAWKRVPLTRAAADEYQINLFGSDVFNLLASKSDSEFRVFAERADGTTEQSIAIRYSIQSVPGELDFPWDRATVTIYQRTTKEIPGSQGQLFLQIGDVTAGHVLVTVRDARYKRIIDMAAMRRHDSVSLPLDDAEYRLVLDQLVNLLTGRDYAVFSLMDVEAWRQDKIERLLSAIENTDAVFLRADREMPGPMFAAHLRQKLGVTRGQPFSVDDFIERVAGSSWSTGQPYQVRLPDGQQIEAETWLRQQLAPTGAPDEDESVSTSTDPSGT